MSSSSILKGKHAVVFGAGGSIGAAVASEFAAEGAEVFLAGRTRSTVEAVTNQITRDGGSAHTQAIDRRLTPWMRPPSMTTLTAS
jgi:3-oxoacyl-[acyl-carrier protein] reductase